MSIIEKLIALILVNISDDIKKAIIAFVLVLEQKAKATKNPYDDMIVKLLKTLLGIK